MQLEFSWETYTFENVYTQIHLRYTQYRLAETHMVTDMHGHRHTNTDMHACMHTHECTQACTHTHTHQWTHAPTGTHALHTHIHMHYTHMHHTHTHIYTTHTCTTYTTHTLAQHHTHTHTHTHRLRQPLILTPSGQTGTRTLQSARCCSCCWLPTPPPCPTSWWPPSSRPVPISCTPSSSCCSPTWLPAPWTPGLPVCSSSSRWVSRALYLPSFSSSSLAWWVSGHEVWQVCCQHGDSGRGELWEALCCVFVWSAKGLCRLWPQVAQCCLCVQFVRQACCC